MEIPKNTTENITVSFTNPEGNPCYFKFQLVLKDTGEVLWTSKDVPPGQAITKMDISRPLEAGSYNAILRITTKSLDTYAPMNGANMEFKLIAK